MYQSKTVRPQERCDITGYLMTIPFERFCPMPAAFSKDSAWLDGEFA